MNQEIKILNYLKYYNFAFVVEVVNINKYENYTNCSWYIRYKLFFGG